MSGHCKDCKYWSRYVREPNDQNKDTDLFGDCNHPKVGGEEEYEEVDGIRDAVHAGGWDSSYFYTGQDFGCCHFEQKVESTK